MNRNTVLLIEDEPGVRFGIRDFLETHGYSVEEAGTCEAGQAAFRSTRPDIVILDHSLPDGTATELLPRLRALDSGAAIVILTAHGTIDLAVHALQQGADHFLTKPVELATLLVIVERLLEERRNRRRQWVRSSKEARANVDPFVGSSAAVRRLAADAQRFLRTDSPVLIRGDTGTGKGVLAEWFHRNGPRSEESFVDLNCAVLSKDLLESELFGHEKGAFTGATTAKVGLLDAAHRGTFFLDEIGDMDPAVQPKFLKVLEDKRFRRLGDVRDRHVDIRLIAATHQDLPQLVRENRFRADLYYRISTIPLEVPALRDRKEDLELLAERLLEQLTDDLGRNHLVLSTRALEMLRAYSWPGNIRELRNVLERAALLCEADVLDARDLRFEAQIAPRAADDSGLTLAELEQRHIERVLSEQGGRVEAAARCLGIPRSSLYEKIKRMGLDLSKP